ncbi:hypothetical protein [Cupriavidus necator]|jgi:hypothetical protein|uniref:hypothetical protein n=1 Tax=Cupriavidus necator TaxID=106590 RepID=UPI0013051351|nr:hypothetical protein [Cupriavidus necator]MDX6010200.1 hypothetical protein [Cupriavidus necator]
MQKAFQQWPHPGATCTLSGKTAPECRAQTGAALLAALPLASPWWCGCAEMARGGGAG